MNSAITEEHLYSLALTQVPGIGLIGAHRLIEAVGSASVVLKEAKRLKDIVPGISAKVTDTLSQCDLSNILRICEAELRFAESNHIQCLGIKDETYPSRLRECDDAPIILFYRGNADLNSLHIINLVGTRHATDYGKTFCDTFIKDLSQLLPDTIIVSGLAYGIDIQAHRAALTCGMNTIGVLAHGLDRIYPAPHRQTAAKMLSQGGLLTEFPSGTNPDRQNFIKRNRIVAGISDATIVVESGDKGGSLITADIAESYHRDCFAVPGRTDDKYSSGCNNLIKNNRATLLQSAEDFLEAMDWLKKGHYNTGNFSSKESLQSVNGIQRQLFPELSSEEELIKTHLDKYPDGLQINTLVVRTNIPINKITGILFDMEMKGIIRAMTGGMYKLI